MVLFLGRIVPVLIGFIAIIFICGGLAILHPFNANLGPDEKQDRTLVNGVMVGGLSIVATGICALLTQDLGSSIIQILVGFAIWYY